MEINKYDIYSGMGVSRQIRMASVTDEKYKNMRRSRTDYRVFLHCEKHEGGTVEWGAVRFVSLYRDPISLKYGHWKPPSDVFMAYSTEIESHNIIYFGTCTARGWTIKRNIQKNIGFVRSACYGAFGFPRWTGWGCSAIK